MRNPKSADQIDLADRKYHQSEKGKAALAKAQKAYYEGKVKPRREFAKECLAWLKAHPDMTIVDYISRKETDESNLRQES